MLSLEATRFDDADLERFRRYQRTTFDVFEEVAATLRPGDTERDVARRIHRGLHAAGAENYFHVPVALFGDRTSYPGDFGLLGALPTERRLAPGDAVILDAAPIFAGYTVDASLAVGPVPAALDGALADLRADIRARVESGATLRDIARAVDAQITDRGLVNCHRKHIGAVLGHRVTRADGAFLRRRKIWGLAPRQVAWFLGRSFLSSRFRPSLTPNWNHGRQSDCPPPDGLWAVEPHVARDGVGAKFEDLLVIRGGRAWWLDDDLPHTRRWKAAGLGAP